MTSDGGFESDLVNHLNSSNKQLHAYRRKQSRFASQDIDILVDSSNQELYAGIEAKSKKIKNKSSKIYFSQHFSTNKDGENQVARITEFLQKTGRDGYLAIAYRRGRGKKVLWYAIDWQHISEKFQNGEKGITKEFIEQKGFRIDENPKQII